MRHALKINRKMKAILNRVRADNGPMQLPSPELISSDAYAKVMNAYRTERDGLMSAEYETLNFCYRHYVKNETLGAWRWLALYEHRELISKIIFDERLRGLDFGGARGPIGMQTDICDRLDRDVLQRKIRISSLNKIDDRQYDFVWSSHTLEHIPEIDAILRGFRRILRDKGWVILHLPAFTCRRWRAKVHKYSDIKGDSSHCHTFCLKADILEAEGLDSVLAIDDLAGSIFHIDSAEMSGDNSIFLVLRK